MLLYNYSLPKKLIVQLCTIIRAKREEKRLSSPISVYATLTPTKVQAFYQCRLGALRIRSTLTAFGQKTTFSGLSLRGLFGRPLKKCNVALPVTPQKADKMAVQFMHFFSPFQNEHVISFQTLSDGFCYLVIARSLLRSSSKIRSLLSVLALSK